MGLLRIKSNGLPESTYISYNGNQIGGIQELLVNLDETGTFQMTVQYIGTDDTIYTRNIFSDVLDRIKILGPEVIDQNPNDHSHELLVESMGGIENTTLTYDDQPLDGITSLFCLFRKGQDAGRSIKTFFMRDSQPQSKSELKAYIDVREEDQTITQVSIFI